MVAGVGSDAGRTAAYPELASGTDTRGTRTALQDAS